MVPRDCRTGGAVLSFINRILASTLDKRRPGLPGVVNKPRLRGEVGTNYEEGGGGLKEQASGKKIREVYTERHTVGLRD